MAKRLLDYDPLTKTKTWHHYDHATGKTNLEEEQDFSAIIANNKRLANDSSYAARGKKADYYHIASIPNSVIVMIKQKHNIDVNRNEDLPRLEKLLMSNEYKYLRTCNKI